MARVLILPGLGGSGPQHWQSLWERLDPSYQRVEQRDWDAPECNAWCERLEATLAEDPRPTILVAHSLACALVAHWAARTASTCVSSALLVAPADVECPRHTPDCVRNFAPLPQKRLPFPSILIASRDDPYADFARAEQLAALWGARFVDAGAQGHINTESQLGTWHFGRALLTELERSAPFSLHPRLAAAGARVAESGLCLLLLTRERRYPWLTLVPKVAGIRELHELDEDDRGRLLEESCAVSRALAHDFGADKVNIGILGNVVPQLHIHHVARFLDDPAWPQPVWGHSPREPYSEAEVSALTERLARGRLRQWFRFDA
jgi:predicted alpha/beta hydrolase family esterase/diadenosine tetraphosphate (Ap4A) HIT family hydrolase